ncbi:2,5-dihydroxypyridine 5,6-dioxygenase [Variovorax gossypii]|uniref:2,5-dihydroxypyridine 5,6-dioxygenase n=1 Tax=Variovorax gossypii TaxID=1679495 RepID=A0A431TCQ5_9BURK|nr:2,5-dihydroxypyridine 5,6-dioxygenase [Variovorax gossypii]MDP9606370.1 2,5-dihydroxypyridine 5,6-dioxygenase [Variovorax paradoxus]RTQ30628.1 2,5-dihydroxypyridine 5,6-dioxygenase [Variovorax gossypii]
MPVSDYQMVKAWDEVLKLSKVERGQKVSILCGPHTHPQTLQTATIAAQAAGAVVTRIELQPINAEKAPSRDLMNYLGETPLTNNPVALAAMKNSDIVLDLMLLLFSPEQMEILESGTKILLAVEPPEVLVRAVPTEADRERVLAASKLLKAARKMHVTSPAGTDVTFKLGDYPTISEYGFCEEPGRWDHWPSGFLFTFANEGGSDGTIVIDRGDILLPQKNYVSDRITMHLREGFVRSIEGDIDAALLREFMEAYKDPEAYAIAHIGWGMQPSCYWHTLSLVDREATSGQDARAFEGNFLFSLGPNNEAGGPRTTPCHLDIPLRNCTVKLDDVVVVRDGKVIDEAFQ